MDNQSKTPKRRGWLKLVFGLSLALNLLVVGAVAGAAWRHGGPDKRAGGPSGPPSGLMMLRALDRDDFRAVLSAARAQEPAPELDRAAYQAQLAAVLRAEDLDLAALDRLLALQQTQAGARLEALSEAWRTHVSAMPADARADYAARLEDFAQWGKRRPKP